MFGDGRNRRHRRQMEEREETQSRLHVTGIVANAAAEVSTYGEIVCAPKTRFRTNPQWSIFLVLPVDHEYQ
jgi:hypothetical protein